MKPIKRFLRISLGLALAAALPAGGATNVAISALPAASTAGSNDNFVINLFDGSGYTTARIALTNLQASIVAAQATHATNADLATKVVAGVTNQWKVDATNALGGTIAAAQATHATNADLATQATGLVHTYTNTLVLYVDPNGNDTTAVAGDIERPWKTIEAAMTNAVASNIVQLAAGTFDTTNGVVQKESGVLRGAGRLATVVRFWNSILSAPNTPGVTGADNATVEDLTLLAGYWDQTNNLAGQACYGKHANQDFGFTNATIRNVLMIASSDGILLSFTNHSSQGQVYDSELKIGGDTILMGSSGEETNTWDFFNCTLRNLELRTNMASYPLGGGNIISIAQRSRARFYNCYFDLSSVTNTARLANMKTTGEAWLTLAGGVVTNKADYEFVAANGATLNIDALGVAGLHTNCVDTTVNYDTAILKPVTIPSGKLYLGQASDGFAALPDTYIFAYETSGTLGYFKVDGSFVASANGFAIGATAGLSTNINVRLGNGNTNQLQFQGGILTGVVPQ